MTTNWSFDTASPTSWEKTGEAKYFLLLQDLDLLLYQDNKKIALQDHG